MNLLNLKVLELCLPPSVAGIAGIKTADHPAVAQYSDSRRQVLVDAVYDEDEVEIPEDNVLQVVEGVQN